MDRETAYGRVGKTVYVAQNPDVRKRKLLQVAVDEEGTDYVYVTGPHGRSFETADLEDVFATESEAQDAAALWALER